MGLDLITYLKYENHPYLNYSYTDIITKEQKPLGTLSLTVHQYWMKLDDSPSLNDYIHTTGSGA